jgi:fatty-acyl-CoA synthase
MDVPFNQVPQTTLTPLAFLERSAEVFPEKTAIVYGEREMTYREFAGEATRLGHALQASGIKPGDRVAYLCPNLPEMLIAHFGVPLIGAVLVAINTRLAPEEVRYICDHSGAKLLVADPELLENIQPVVDELKTVQEIVELGDGYQDLLARGKDDPIPWRVDDEMRTISINYTSGTTGQPKGVMYTHRGAYLNALGEVIHSRHTPDSVYLWTLPMFHCNGWCTTWAVTAIGGRHVCLRAVRADQVWDALKNYGITHLNGAPTVLTTIANADQAQPLDREVIVTTAGAPPSPTIIGQMEELGARVIHVYGLTETYGPYTVCEWQDEWADEDFEARTRLQARQGVAMVISDPIRIVDDDMNDVPRDGETMGEIVMRGNNVMEGYFEDPDETEKAFKGGWFHSGDLGVWHSDGYIQLRDRSKDVIVSGGENISTIEVEQAIVKHPGVLEAAVIGVPNEKWGERPKAFVILKSGADVSEEELVEHCREQIARYKVPDSFDIVEELPKTSTGKIQKFELREKEWAGQQDRIKG